MKKISLTLILILACFILRAQTPNSFKYQALARTATGEIMASEAVEFTITILENSITGTPVYSETHSVTTNQFGLVSFNIGEGTNPTSTFAEIDWSNGTYFVEIKLNGNLIGTSQLLSVPFAKYADKAGNTFSGNYNDLTNRPDLALKLDTLETLNWDKDVSDDFSGNYDDLTNKPNIDQDTLNEIQSVYVSPIGDTLFLSNSNYVIIPGISSVNDPNISWQPGDKWFDGRDSTFYKTTVIGNQIWMAENLRATQYTDGTPINLITDNTEWKNLEQDSKFTYKAYCWYNNDEATYKDTYGVLYTWAAALNGVTGSSSIPSGIQGVCPVGWHVPSDAEWTVLTDYLISNGLHSGTALKANYGWNGAEGTDNYGFSALPSSFRNSTDGSFTANTNAHWWSSTRYYSHSNYVYYNYLYFDRQSVESYFDRRTRGYSVRCVKD